MYIPEYPGTKNSVNKRTTQCYLTFFSINVNQKPTLSHVKLRLPTKPLFQWGKRIIYHSNSIRILL